MCGIAGFADALRRSDGDTMLAVVRRMADTMRHRGPDDQGEWLSPDGRVALAQRRLAVIDLSPTGHQPMTDASGELRITHNGEIYNYRELRRELETRGHQFRGASDTEVILEAYREWGNDCLTHFNGAFAFALYDSAEGTLFMARDRAGEKPLFYRHTDGALIFASELKAIMSDPAFSRELDLDSLNHYLAYGCAPGDGCMLKGVSKLAPGHAMIYDLESDNLRVWRYWSLPADRSEKARTEDELVEEFEDLLADSVRLRLIADVPLGILLSGGIDSSLVTAMAARISSGVISTFTISFPGHGAFDEGAYARLVARHFGTNHVELAAEPASVELLPKLARQYDEPLADHSIVPTYLVSRLVRPHATVALGGDGGDELFGGYEHYNFVQRQHRLRRFIPRPIRSLIGATAARVLPIGVKGRNHLIGFTDDLPRSIAHINLYFDARSRERLLAPARRSGDWSLHRPEKYKMGLAKEHDTPLRMATSVDFQTTMVDDYLVKVDRASMLASLEVRAPFLDHRLVEFAFGRVPDHLRATESERKVLPRRLARRLLPPDLDLDRKQGFSLPLASWFKGEWGNFVKEVLGEADPELFDKRIIRGLIAGQRHGLANANRLFALTMFELWRREYGVRIVDS